MAMNHLSDTEMQDYLDANLIGEKKSTVIQHLKDCELCRHEMQRYKTLYAELKSDIGIELSPNFSSVVISRLQQETSEVFYLRFRDIFLSILGLLVGLATMLYYVDFKPVLNSFYDIFESNKYVKPELISGVKDFFVGFNLDFNLLIFGGLILLIFITVDHIIIRHKDKLLSFLRIVPIM